MISTISTSIITIVSNEELACCNDNSNVASLHRPEPGRAGVPDLAHPGPARPPQRDRHGDDYYMTTTATAATTTATTTTTTITTTTITTTTTTTNDNDTQTNHT